MGQTIGKSGEQRRGASFCREKEDASRDCFAKFSLAWLLMSKEKFFLASAGVCKVNFFLLGN